MPAVNEVQRVVSSLVRQLGESTVAGALGVEEEVLVPVMLGEMPLDETSLKGLEELCTLLSGSAGWVEESPLWDGGVGGNGAGVPAPLMLGNQEMLSGGRVIPDVGSVPVSPEDMTTSAELESFQSLAPNMAVQPGETWVEEMERTRDSLRRARALGVMTQFRSGMSYQEYVASLGMIQEIELALITLFDDTVPEPGALWSAERRLREQELRIRRLQWVQKEQKKEYTGIKGVWNWLMGRERLRGVDLYTQVLNDADSMLIAMNVDVPAHGTLMESAYRFGIGNSGTNNSASSR